MNSKDPNHREKISKLVKKHGGKDPVFLENCIDIFDSFADFDWHPDSKRYLHECIPVSEIKIDNFIMLTASRIIEESKDMIPGVYVSKLGFIPIATYYSGDPYVLEAATGMVFCLAHGKYDVAGIDQGWNSTFTKKLPRLQIEKDSVVSTAEISFSNIFDFLDHIDALSG